MPALVSRMFDDAQQVRLESMATIAPVNIFAGREDSELLQTMLLRSMYLNMYWQLWRKH